MLDVLKNQSASFRSRGKYIAIYILYIWFIVSFKNSYFLIQKNNDEKLRHIVQKFFFMKSFSRNFSWYWFVEKLLHTYVNNLKNPYSPGCLIILLSSRMNSSSSSSSSLSTWVIVTLGNVNLEDGPKLCHSEPKRKHKYKVLSWCSLMGADAAKGNNSCIVW